MLQPLMKKWNVSGRDLVVILVVFAITGLTTAYISKAITGWVGFTDDTHWGWKLMLRLLMLIFGYQFILLTVAFLLGQFQFFWRFERNLLTRLGFFKQEAATPTHMKEKIKLAVFASGTGSNTQKLIDHFRDSAVAEISLVVCNKPGAGVIDIAKKENIPVLTVERKRFLQDDGYVNELTRAGIGFIVLAGFLWKIPTALINAFPRKIVNIHPALLPKHGGKGMYGQYVHEAVLNAGEVETGISIHYVDEHYDSGDIIFQTACPVLESDGPEDIAKRVHLLEYVHYPAVVESVVEETFHRKKKQ